MKHGKSYRQAAEKREQKAYSAEDAMQFVVENKKAKFDESVEVHVRLKIDPKKGDQQVRAAVVLPHGTGKEKKIAVATGTAEKEAKAAGADKVYNENIVEEIKSGKFFVGGFDVLVATPDMMPKLAPVAKILGPRGLMPSPKAETVTTKVEETISMLKKGKVTFKNDNTGNVHQVIGRVSFGTEKLVENYNALMDALQKSKPEGVKGTFIASVSVCSTMGVGIKTQ